MCVLVCVGEQHLTHNLYGVFPQRQMNLLRIRMS